MESKAIKNPVGWFEIYVDDMARARKFYESVFQVKLEKMEGDMPDMEMWLFQGNDKAAGIYGGLVKMEDMPAGKNSVLIYFNCDDCSAEASRIEEFGGNLIRPKFDIGEYGFIALAQDSEGNMIGLHSFK